MVSIKLPKNRKNSEGFCIRSFLFGISAILSFLCLSTAAFSQTTYYSAQSGNWNAESTWTAGVVPGPTDNAVIREDHTVTLIVVDDEGAASAPVTTTATIDPPPANIPPTSDPNGPYTGTTGLPVSFDGSGQGTVPHQYTAADTIDGYFTATGANLSVLTQGKLIVRFRVINANGTR